MINSINIANLQEFHKPGPAYKQVKAESMRLPDVHGEDVTHRVMVYISTSGTPHFAIGVPSDYANAWERHRDKELTMFNDRIPVLKGVVSGASFDEVLKSIEVIGRNFQKHIRNLKMRKVIRLVIEVKGALGHKAHNEPSFSNSRVLVGLCSGVYWEVNGGYYAWDGRHRDGKRPHGSADLPDEGPGEPSYADLRPSDMRGNPTTIPFTPEVWATVQQVESMLERAGGMLLGLAKEETAASLLQGGFQELLKAPVAI
jgi:hypothetical protein